MGKCSLSVLCEWDGNPGLWSLATDYFSYTRSLLSNVRTALNFQCLILCLICLCNFVVPRTWSPGVYSLTRHLLAFFPALTLGSGLVHTNTFESTFFFIYVWPTNVFNYIFFSAIENSMLGMSTGCLIPGLHVISYKLVVYPFIHTRVWKWNFLIYPLWRKMVENTVFVWMAM